jgi:membrane-bound lytic murein transglycosylase MltF
VHIPKILEDAGFSKRRSRYILGINPKNHSNFQYDLNHYKLIAQAYQESRLNQHLVSPRGAVGIMQLLPSTAADKNVGIEDIKVLENNIHAGAKYMDFIRIRYFDSPDISAEDQIFFSWAAYNAGPENVQKMRNLTEKMGLDNNVWFNNVEIAAGRIIGTETVRYVANIHKYYSTYLLLDQKEMRESSK